MKCLVAKRNIYENIERFETIVKSEILRRTCCEALKTSGTSQQMSDYVSYFSEYSYFEIISFSIEHNFLKILKALFIILYKQSSKIPNSFTFFVQIINKPFLDTVSTQLC